MTCFLFAIVFGVWGAVRPVSDRLGLPEDWLFPAEETLEIPLQARGMDGLVEVLVSIDGSKQVAISPFIYGISRSEGAEPYFSDMGVTVVRWGGNARSRFNWEINASNTGADFAFMNVPKGDDVSGSAGIAFHRANAFVGAQSLLTIPMIGWVAGDRGAAVATSSDPVEVQRAASVRSFPRKSDVPTYPPDARDGAVYQDEWVAFLVENLGHGDEGGVRLYEMDNEPALWHVTHRDVRPNPLGYDEYLQLFSDYSNAVKDADPSALVVGPAEWGWPSYFYSALDQRAWWGAPDRERHGGLPFIPWFLQETREHDREIGRRSLDILSVHYYPAGGVFSTRTDPQTNSRRLRSTRSLWDPGYKDESWIRRTEEGPYVRLLPRLKEWVDQNYPGTKIALTEWNWGAEEHITGGLAVADVLGILGREQVYLATYWGTPDPGLPTYWAFRMYRNYDGAGHGFGDVSVQANSSLPDVVSSHGSYDSATRQWKVILINKSPDQVVRAHLDIPSLPPTAGFRCFRYEDGATEIQAAPTHGPAGEQPACELSPYSITMAVVDTSESSLVRSGEPE